MIACAALGCFVSGVVEVVLEDRRVRSPARLRAPLWLRAAAWLRTVDGPAWERLEQCAGYDPGPCPGCRARYARLELEQLLLEPHARSGEQRLLAAGQISKYLFCEEPGGPMGD